MASTPFLRTFSWRPETAEGCGENLAAMRGKQLTVSHFSMRVDDAVGLFWGQRVGWVLPLAHVASESEAVERAEWSVRRSEFRREARSKLGGFTLALPFVSDDRDDRHLGERHVRRACRLFCLRNLLHFIEIRQNKRGSIFSTISKEKRLGSPSRRPARRYILSSLTGVSRVQRCNWPRSRDESEVQLRGAGALYLGVEASAPSLFILPSRGCNLPNMYVFSSQLCEEKIQQSWTALSRRIIEIH